jgi:hypothetical protein
VRVNILVAYPYIASDPKMLALLEQAAAAGHRVMVDSGAFTAHTTGKQVSLVEYIRWLRHCPFTPSCYVTLDVIGNPAASRVNLQRMQDAGLRPAPVFTYGETPAELDAMYEASPLVCVGGLIGRTGKLQYMAWAMRHAAGRPVHLLGNVTPPVIAAHRPAQCDASNWMEGCRYGHLNLYLGRGRWMAASRHSDMEPVTPALTAALAEHGTRLHQLADRGAWTGANGLVQLTATCAWLRYAADVEQEWGTHVYMAAAQSMFVAQLLRVAPIAGLSMRERRAQGPEAWLAHVAATSRKRRRPVGTPPGPV